MKYTEAREAKFQALGLLQRRRREEEVQRLSFLHGGLLIKPSLLELRSKLPIHIFELLNYGGSEKLSSLRMYMIHTHVHACMGLQWTPDNTSLWAVKFRFIKQFMYTLPPDKPSYRLHIVYPHFLAPSVLGFQMAVLRKVCLLTGGPTLTGVSCVRFDFCSKAKLFSCLFSPH